MSVSESPLVSKSLVARVKGIIMRPNEEWAAIDTESATVTGLYTSYIAPLSAIPPIALFIRTSVFGWGYRMPIGWGAESAIVQYVLGLVSVYLVAVIVDMLAPNFGGQRSRIQALKVVAYSFTAFWLAGVFWLVPGLSLLGILGFYSLYLLYVGLPLLMKAPPERAIGYTVVSIVCGIVLSWFIFVFASGIFVGGYSTLRIPR
jgi:hypothetical protein